jgi:hypothetical protein
MDRPPPPRLSIVFPKPGFFLADVRTVVTLDGSPIYDGSFTRGFALVHPILPGPHTIGTQIFLGLAGLARSRRYMVDVKPGLGLNVELSYSRFWGNFTKAPKLR